MGGATGQQIERVRQQRKNRRKRGPRTGRTPRQVDDQGAPDRAADCAAQWSKWRVQKTFGAHAFGQAIDQPVTDKPRGLGGNVARGQPCAARGHDKIRAGCVTLQSRGDQIELIGERLHYSNAQPCRLEKLADRGARLVHLLATKAAIANCQNDGASLNGSTCSHSLSVLVVEGATQKGPCSRMSAKGEKI